MPSATTTVVSGLTMAFAALTSSALLAPAPAEPIGDSCGNGFACRMHEQCSSPGPGTVARRACAPRKASLCKDARGHCEPGDVCDQFNMCTSRAGRKYSMIMNADAVGIRSTSNKTAESPCTSMIAFIESCCTCNVKNDEIQTTCIASGSNDTTDHTNDLTLESHMVLCKHKDENPHVRVKMMYQGAPMATFNYTAGQKVHKVIKLEPKYSAMLNDYINQAADQAAKAGISLASAASMVTSMVTIDELILDGEVDTVDDPDKFRIQFAVDACGSTFFAHLCASSILGKLMDLGYAATFEIGDHFCTQTNSTK